MFAHAECNPQLTSQIMKAERIADSLRPEKAGQMRTIALDGSEYTAGQALWMKGQFRAIVRACAQGDEALATSRLQDVMNLIEARRH